ncbi:hypothetical protein [Frigoribacterium sp. Leaf186]|uniref:hypothetical protein n=1 Tax=Frigoribacterium sp. Leaf186 TaxID=1736293 RepID=UPI0006FAF7CF|nr:hypothetical protein [Frigoribacterium sp. Leaf186]KQS22697.1 hypothetical protein ASG05_03995 [Frigoribacterium sp. Leaf186]
MTKRALLTVFTAGAVVLALAACTGGDAEPTPTLSSFTPTSTASPAAPDTGAETTTPTPPSDDPSAGDPTDDGSAAVETPVPVPADQADGWTDARAYDACRNEATRSQGSDYRWNDRSSQILVQGSAGRSIDVAGLYSGGDVGVANVVYRCVVGGTPDAPQLSGTVVR